MIKYVLLMVILSSCQQHYSDEPVISKEMEQALKNNDTALAQKIAQQELDKSRASIADSSFAALIDATLELQSLGFKIQKINPATKSEIISDSLVSINEGFTKLHSFIIRVYEFALKRSSQKSDITYYTEKIAIPYEEWLMLFFKGRTKKELQISELTLQKDIAIASGIINGADTKEGRREIENSYTENVRITKETK